MNIRLMCACVCAAAIASLSQAATAADRTVLIATWRGCEEACQGFQDYFADTGHDVAFILDDADQDTGNLPGILADARAKNVDLIVTWGTSVTRGIAGKLPDAGKPEFNDSIPLVFMIVADPVGAGIVESLDATGRDNVTGTYNRVPEKVVIATIRRYLPSFSHLGMLYTSSEANSVLKRDEIAGLAEAQNFELTSVDLDPIGGIAAIAEGMAQLKSAGADFLYIGSSSELRANAADVAAAALAEKLPVMSPYEEMVRNGSALISIAARYYDVGKLAGKQAERILYDGTLPGDLPVARLMDFAVTVNMTFAKKVSALPPVDILQIAETVN
jgi:putative ABC transport system substrate-binding protein